jgi:hypothetical protein
MVSAGEVVHRRAGIDDLVGVTFFNTHYFLSLL